MSNHKLIDLLEDHAAWAAETFPKATATGATIHATLELGEVIDELTAEPVNKEKLATEIADTLFCLFDAARRSGIRIDDIVAAGRVKLEINKLRTWSYNGDGSYSHVKPARVAMEPKLVALLKDMAGVDKISYDDRLVEDLGLDSLDKLHLIDLCEEAFGVRLGEVDYKNLNIVGDLHDILRDKLN